MRILIQLSVLSLLIATSVSCQGLKNYSTNDNSLDSTAKIILPDYDQVTTSPTSDLVVDSNEMTDEEARSLATAREGTNFDNHTIGTQPDATLRTFEVESQTYPQQNRSAYSPERVDDQPIPQVNQDWFDSNEPSHGGSHVRPASYTQPNYHSDDDETTEPPPTLTIEFASANKSDDSATLVPGFPGSPARIGWSEIDIKVIAKNASGVAGELELRVSHGGSWTTSKQTPSDVGGSNDKLATFKVAIKEGINQLAVSWVGTDGFDPKSDLIDQATIVLDQEGPILQSAQLLSDPTRGDYLKLHFVDSDWDTAKNQPTTTNFQVVRQELGGGYSNVPFQGEAEINGSSIKLYFAMSLPEGSYELRISSKAPAPSESKPTVLVDALGNAAEDTDSSFGGQTWRFSSLGQSRRGEHREFPQYAPPKQLEQENGFNPADFVETRVMRLYYFRDAHRVAQIINRNIQSLNRAAVAQAERRAQDARIDANNKTDSRRKAEREAIIAAEQARVAENKLNTKRQELSRVRQATSDLEFKKRRLARVDSILEQITAAEMTAKSDANRVNVIREELSALSAKYEKANNELTFNPPPTDSGKLNLRNLITDITKDISDKKAELATARLTASESQAKANAIALEFRKNDLVIEKRELGFEIADYESLVSQLGDLSSLDSETQNLERTVANLRETAIVRREKTAELEAKEERAYQNRFRQEVSAAKADPDTYVPGNIDSVDPVSQCSLSVIGEGLIQIRGPIKGINKIRRMINQIDFPRGQVKVGINTVQVNGERGNRMERVVGRIESHIDLGRYLTSQSMMLLRKAVQQVAAEVAANNDSGQHYQVDRDRKYLYSFYGRDFIDELYEMDSEFLHSQNKVLSLHSMDTISFNRALFTIALAKNDIRAQIMERFMQMVYCELPEAEWDFRRSSDLIPHKNRRILPQFNKTKLECNTLDNVIRNAKNKYHFRNLRGFLDTGMYQSDTMNPAQREFIRLAQIFKSQMIAEVELKQRVIERALITDGSGNDEKINNILRRVNSKSIDKIEVAYEKLLNASDNLRVATDMVNKLQDFAAALDVIRKLVAEFQENPMFQNIFNASGEPTADEKLFVDEAIPQLRNTVATLNWRNLLKVRSGYDLRPSTKELVHNLQFLEDELQGLDGNFDTREKIQDAVGWYVEFVIELNALSKFKADLIRTQHSLQAFYIALLDPKVDDQTISRLYGKLVSSIESFDEIEIKGKLLESVKSAYSSRGQLALAEAHIDQAEYFANRTRTRVDHRKMLDFLIDEHEEKYIELVEGTRSHIATIDNHLKRLAIALEDDFKVQFYDPAWYRIRSAAREHDVSLGQVEKTTILTNNRAFAKVSPQATMEFDLPKRRIAIVEALDGAKALAEDYGALLNDPTFLAAFEMLGGAKQGTSVKNLIPGLPTSTDQHEMGLVSDPARQSDSALQNLVPDPAVYKFETGTGFEVRPVIQPDGDSVVYDFNYMYTTNVREPVAADEKHLGRIKRHFVDTQVQTSSFELREISRYQVALKASRTAKGVPLFEDIPVAGALFRPAASDESSLQQNIILGSTTVYPTLFDLMGLRWAPHVVDLDHLNLLDSEHVIRGRRESIRHHVFDEASRRVDNFLHLPRLTPEHHRPDLYHSNSQPSKYHPRGYTYPNRVVDPSGDKFERHDRRPQEWRVDPPYDRYRHRPIQPETIRGYPQQPELIQGRPILGLSGDGTIQRQAIIGGYPRPEPIQGEPVFGSSNGRTTGPGNTRRSSSGINDYERDQSLPVPQNLRNDANGNRN